MLSDRNALRLTELLHDYFVDCVTIDPSTTPPNDLTVMELIEDLASSTNEPEAREIEASLDATLNLFDAGSQS